MNSNDKFSIGILGFGTVGKAALQFITECWPAIATALHKHGIPVIRNQTPYIHIWDQRTLDDHEYKLINDTQAQLADKNCLLSDFLAQHHIIIPSPGIDILNSQLPPKTNIIDEIDLFAWLYSGLSIAITGTIGKTSVTSLLGDLLIKAYDQAMIPNKPVIGGNIGTSMLNLLNQKEIANLAVLELSSFQLERAHHFSPDIAILTSFYPNHLDRHKTLEAYFHAKQQLFVQQKPDQHAIIPLQLYNDYPSFFKELIISIRSSVLITSPKPLSSSTIEKLIDHRTAFLSFDGNNLIHTYRNQTDTLETEITPLQRSDFPHITFDENWLLVTAALYSYGCSWNQIRTLIRSFTHIPLAMMEHRVELVRYINGCAFYNDSKGTIMQATQAALERLAQHYNKITLILGGTDKGIDRTTWVQELAQQPYIKKLYWLGSTQPSQTHIPSYNSLDTLLATLIHDINPGEAVLFSPSGASYDLFKHYPHRGDTFKKIVTELATKCS